MSYQHVLEDTERIDGVNSSTTLMTIETAKDIITDVLNMTEVIFAMKELYGKSPLLQTEFLPFFTNLNVVHESTMAVLDSEEKHQAYLNNLIGLCGMKRLEMEKDGNCFYTSTAAALKVLWDNVSADKKNQLKRLPIDIELTELDIVSSQLRSKICKEWINNGESYQGFLQHCNVNDEAIRFLQDGYFASELGDTVLMALANCLTMPVVALSSHAGILMFKPREYLSFTPIILAYNAAYGPGHYDALGYFQSSIATETTATKKLKCKCGMNGAVAGQAQQLERCCPSNLYNSRCPCLKSSTACSDLCKCKNCHNPIGKKPTKVASGSRQRQIKHALKTLHVTQSEFF